ncbi:hypothetical protein GCM10009594_16280 [Kocuria palustris]
MDGMASFDAIIQCQIRHGPHPLDVSPSLIKWRITDLGLESQLRLAQIMRSRKESDELLDLAIGNPVQPLEEGVRQPAVSQLHADVRRIPQMLMQRQPRSLSVCPWSQSWRLAPEPPHILRQVHGCPHRRVGSAFVRSRL